MPKGFWLFVIEFEDDLRGQFETPIENVGKRFMGLFLQFVFIRSLY